MKRISIIITFSTKNNTGLLFLPAFQTNTFFQSKKTERNSIFPISYI
ncbi:MAG: hypothetical protein L3J54_07030 [Draconibacterium sp.]|nr:hypothetical protein [Draconibacterium sp.]